MLFCLFVCLFVFAVLSDIAEFEDIKKTSHIMMGKFVQGLYRSLFRVGNVDACKGCMCVRWCTR